MLFFTGFLLIDFVFLFTKFKFMTPENFCQNMKRILPEYEKKPFQFF